MDISKKVLGKEEKWRRRRLWPLIFILTVIPLLMFIVEYNPRLGDYIEYNYDTSYDDYFLAIKEYALILAGVVMLIILLVEHFKDGIKFKRIWLYFPLGGYMLFALLSSVAAINRRYAFLGGYEQFQGFFALLTYGVAIVYAVQYIRDIEDVKYIVKRFLIGITVMCLIGIIQITGHDLLDFDIIRYMISPISKWDEIDMIGENDLAKNVFLTLYNPNYVGSYVALILPFTFVLTYMLNKKRDVLCCIMIAAGLLLSLIGSGSATGMIGVIVEILAFIILLRKQLIQRWYFTTPVILAIVVLCFTPFVKNRVATLMNSFNSTVDSQKKLTAIRTNDENVEIDYNGNTLILSQLYDDENFYGYAMQDQDYNSIHYTLDEETMTFTITDEVFSGIQIKPGVINGILSMEVIIDGQSWDFTDLVGEENTYFYYYPYASCYEKIMVADSIGFKGHENFATGRGYLWSRTLPLLKDSVLLGCGPDNFMFKFTTNDFVMRYRTGFLDGMITKPHNMYLQMAVETGVTSLIAFLVFYLGYFVMSIKLYMRSLTDSPLKKYGVSIFLGTIGYMVAGLANDAMIVVAPIFWVLIGIGIAVNLLIINEQKKQQSTVVSE